MLVLPSDSGYNSPCDGIGPSSLYPPSEKFSKHVISSEVRRKLRFESHTSWDTGSYFTSSKSSHRSREIARRLILICDLLEKECAEIEIAKDLTWTASIFRLFGL